MYFINKQDLWKFYFSHEKYKKKFVFFIFQRKLFFHENVLHLRHENWYKTDSQSVY